MKHFIYIFILLITLSCGHHHSKDSKIKQDIIMGKELKANQYSNLYFSGQPSNEDFKKLKEQGFAAIINLRTKNEYNEKNEKELAKKLKINYYNIPFSMKDKLETDLVNRITSSVVKHRKEGKILVHCSSGNRVGIWLGAHFYKDHKYTKEKSLETAKELGLNKSTAIKKLMSYYNEN